LTRGRNETREVVLSLGSNLGDREGSLRAALEALSGELDIAAVSSLYETDPIGVTDQPAFLNLAVAGRTSKSPEDLLVAVKRIEAAVGRRPTFRWGPRVVDIDIVLYGDEIVRTPALTIPHKELARRAFVLVPMAEIVPNRVHPESGKTVARLLAEVPGRDGVRLYQAPNLSSDHGSPSM
jgi:2-amino-4-hydroxy-6-hydroxymethyldihydropteridine diphosphokinase